MILDLPSDDYRVKTDSLNWVLQKKHIGCGEKNFDQVVWTSIKWFHYFEHLLETYFQLEVREMDVGDMDELVGKAKELRLKLDDKYMTVSKLIDE